MQSLTKNKEQEIKLCLLRDIYRSIRNLEIEFQDKYDLCLNDGMALCSLKEEKMSSTALATKLGLSASNMSKVIKSIEDKGLVRRRLGEKDKRQMYFTLTKKGEEILLKIESEEDSINEVFDYIYNQKLSEI